MVAQSLVIKAKNAMIEEAVDILYGEIEAKRIAINGKFMPMELEKSGEMEQGLFLIRHMLEQKPEMEKYFAAMIKDYKARKSPDEKTVRTMENLKKFMDAVDRIEALTHYGLLFDKWFNDVSKSVAGKAPEEILAKTSGGPKTHRAEAVRFLVKQKLFNDDDIFTKEERKVFTEALELLDSDTATASSS